VNIVARSPAQSSIWPGHYRWSMPEMAQFEAWRGFVNGKVYNCGTRIPETPVSRRQWVGHCMSGSCLLLVWIMPLSRGIGRIVSLLRTRILVDIQRIGESIPVSRLYV
jgi:hypothetical protein